MWVPFFNRPASREKKCIDELLDEDRAAVVGPIVTEVLRGFRNEHEANWVASLLRGVRCLDLGWPEWTRAGALGRMLASRGH
jgi:hypothetical protein